MPTGGSRSDGVCMLRVDESALSFAVEEGLSNARKYRLGVGSPIHVSATFESVDPAERTAALGDDRERLLHVKVCNLSSTLLSKEDCNKAFEPGYKAHVEDASSDGLGLESVRKAVVGANGSTWLQMHRESDGGAWATLHIVLPVEVEHTSQLMSGDDGRTPPVPSPVPPPSVAVVADAGAPQLETLVVAVASAPSTARPAAGWSASRRPIVCCVDDSDAMRNLLEMILEDFMDAEGLGHLSGTLGATRAEQVAFIDVALGRLDLQLQPRSEVPREIRAADITIIDQNLWAEDEPTLLGTELVRQLRAAGFLGVCCILTGASDEEISSILACPGVDLALPKITSAKKLAEQCLLASAERRSHAP